MFERRGVIGGAAVTEEIVPGEPDLSFLSLTPLGSERGDLNPKMLLNSWRCFRFAESHPLCHFLGTGESAEAVR